MTNKDKNNNTKANDKSKKKSEKLMEKFEKYVEENAEKEFQKMLYKEIYTLQDSMKFFKENKDEMPNVKGFYLSVKKNTKPKQENDQFIIFQCLIDANDKPITVNGQTAFSIDCRAKTIDDKIIQALDGEESVIIK